MSWAPLITGLASGAASAGVGGLLGGLFGGGSQASPSDMMDAFIDSYEDSLKEANERAVAAYQEGIEQNKEEIAKLEKQYTDKNTRREFKSAILPDLYKNTIDMVKNHGYDATTAANQFMTLAEEAGLNPTSVVNLPGHGASTLLRLTQQLKSDSFNSIPSKFNYEVANFFRDQLGRNPTESERNFYSYGRFKSLDEVISKVVQEYPEVFNKNMSTLAPELSARNMSSWGGMSAVTPNTPGFGAPVKSGEWASANTNWDFSNSMFGTPTESKYRLAVNASNRHKKASSSSKNKTASASSSLDSPSSSGSMSGNSDYTNT